MTLLTEAGASHVVAAAKTAAALLAAQTVASIVASLAMRSQSVTLRKRTSTPASTVPVQNSMPQDGSVNGVEAVVKDEAEAAAPDKLGRCQAKNRTLATRVTRNPLQGRTTWVRSGSTRKTDSGYSTAPVE